MKNKIRCLIIMHKGEPMHVISNYQNSNVTAARLKAVAREHGYWHEPGDIYKVRSLTPEQITEIDPIEGSKLKENQ